MSQFNTDNFEQSEQLSGMEDVYKLGPLQAGPPCCDPKPLIQVENLSLHYGAKPAPFPLSIPATLNYHYANTA